MSFLCKIPQYPEILLVQFPEIRYNECDNEHREMMHDAAKAIPSAPSHAASVRGALSLGIFLFMRNYRYARRFVQLLVGLYMLVYLGLISQENMQIEGFWYYLFTGVFEAATIHYAVAKIFGPLLFGRGWCGYACWTAMVLDFLPYKVPKQPHRSFLWRRCFSCTWGIWSVSCSGRLFWAISPIMGLESPWPFAFRITAHSANISAPSPFF